MSRSLAYRSLLFLVLPWAAAPSGCSSEGITLPLSNEAASNGAASNGAASNGAAETVAPHASHDPHERADLGPEPSGYLSEPQIDVLLHSWSQVAPNIAEYTKFGGSAGLVALRISGGIKHKEKQLPKVLVTSGLHGDEQLGTACVLGTMHRLLQNYGKDATVTKLIDSRELYFVPVNNPLGYANDTPWVPLDGSVLAAATGGGDSLSDDNPNRTFPSPLKPNAVSPYDYVEAIKHFFWDHGFKAVLDIHGAGQLILTPFSYTSERFDDNGAGDIHRKLARELAEPLGYNHGSILEMYLAVARAQNATQAQMDALSHFVATGAKAGTSLDYWYLEGKKRGFHTVSLTVEVGTEKKPPLIQLRAEVERVYPMIIGFAQKAPVALLPGPPPRH